MLIITMSNKTLERVKLTGKLYSAGVLCLTQFHNLFPSINVNCFVLFFKFLICFSCEERQCMKIVRDISRFAFPCSWFLLGFERPEKMPQEDVQATINMEVLSNSVF